MNCSLSDITGSSTGNPPACHTPRFTCSARSRRCEWQVLRSLQVLSRAMTGLPAKSSVSKPMPFVRER